jgi:hypothetical protein
MKRFLGVLIASMFLASAAYAADDMKKADEKTTEAKDKAKDGKAKAKNGDAKAKSKGDDMKAEDSAKKPAK